MARGRVCHWQSAENVLSCEKRLITLAPKWLHVKYLLNIFTADCLRHPIQMVGIETIWELHKLPVINSW